MKNKKLVFPAVLAAVFAFSLAFVSCGSETSKLVGVWENEEEGSIELLDDATGIIDGQNVIWNVENGLLNVSNGFTSISYRYVLSGKELSLTYDGETVVFTKK
jgi:hypothetical protein